MPSIETLQKYFRDEARLHDALPLAAIEQMITALERARTEGRRVFVFGNGGSAATASHLACDLGKGTIQPGLPRFKIHCLNDSVSTLTAYANDMGYENIFSEPLISLAEHGDIALAISASGNSPNVVNAIKTARTLGLVTLGLTGFTGGTLRDLVEIHIHVPSPSYGHIEDLHLAICHAVCEVLKLDHS